MDFRPDIDAHLAAKKRQYTKKKKRVKRLLAAVLIITILAIWALIGFIAYRLWQSNAPAAVPAVTTAATEYIPETEPPLIVTEAEETVTVLLDTDDVLCGELMLVSFVRDAEYSFDANGGFIPLYGNKSQSYRISSTALTLHKDTVDAFNEMFDAYFAETGNKDYQITQGSRSYDEQKSIYDSYLETYGVEVGSSLAAVPGYSEHHSGYAVDMNVYTSSGVSYSLGTARDVDPIYGWIYDNAAKYGFVVRYPDGKTDITGITNEPWHFRYVGKGHASYMSEKGLVLEEYVDLLYKHPYGGEHLTFSYDGVDYEVFYVLVDSDECEIEIPDVAYTVSGNNIDGVIVTLMK